MTVLPKVLGVQVCQPILALEVANADLVLFYQLLYENIIQHDVLCARTVGAVAGDVQR